MKKIIGFAMAIVMLLSMAAFAELPTVEKTDRFSLIDTENGQSMISSDGGLIIHINTEIPAFLENGDPVYGHITSSEAFAEFLDGKKLTVTYSIATHSIPPQTTPTRILVHDEAEPALVEDDDGDAPVEIVPLIHEFTPEEMAELFPLNGEIVIRGRMIEAPAPYYSGGVVMVPLRVIAEEMGFDVAWNNELRSVTLGVAINLWIGKDYFTVGRMAPIELDAAPEFTDGNIYVPLTFFRKILVAYDIYVFEGQVVIGPAGEMI